MKSVVQEQTDRVDAAVARPKTSIPAAWIFAFAQLAFLITVTIWVSARDPIFRAYYPLLQGGAREADAAVINSWLSSSEPVGNLNSDLKNGQLRTKEEAHFVDVRKWLQRLNFIIPSLALCLVALLVAQRKILRPFLHSAQVRALLLLLVVGVAGGALALWDWKVFFGWLHYPLFGPTSWKLPKSCYTLQLFPAAFWRAMGMVVVAAPAAFVLLTLGLTRPKRNAA